MSDWQRSVVLLTNNDDQDDGFGTGFVFHVDSTGRRFVLTCLHVVELLEQGRPRQPEDSLRLLADGVTAEVQARGDRVLDLAILAVDGLDVAALPLGGPAEPGIAFETKGYMAFEKSSATVVDRPLSGELRSRNQVKARRVPQRAGAWIWDVSIEADEFRSLEEGYSGSPLWDPRSSTVVGIMNMRLRAHLGHAICARCADLLSPAPAQLPDYGRSTLQVAVLPAATPGYWVASEVDHTEQLARIARSLDAAAPARAGPLFFAYSARDADRPRSLAEHAALRFARLPPDDSLLDELVLAPPMLHHGEDGVWRALVEKLGPPGGNRLGEAKEQELVLDWLDGAEPGNVRVLHVRLSVKDHWRDIPGLIDSTVKRLGESAHSRRGDAVVLCLFACISGRHDWPRLLWLRWQLRRATGCVSLAALRPLSHDDVEQWLDEFTDVLGRELLARLRTALSGLFGDGQARLPYRIVQDAAIAVLDPAVDGDSSKGGSE